MTTIENEYKNVQLSETVELIKLNKLFSQRYTDEDKEYIQMTKQRSQSPPIVDDWGQNKSNYRNQRRYYSNDHYNNNNNRRDYQQYKNYSHDNRYRRDRTYSPSYHQDKRR